MNGWSHSPERLREIPFFQKLTGPQIEEIQAVSTVREFDPGDAVFREGDPGDAVYFLLRGAVRVHKKLDEGERSLARLEMNATFGEIAFLLGSARSATVTVEEPATVMQLARRDFNVLLNAESTAAYKLVYNMVLVLAARLHRMDDVLIHLLERSTGTDPGDLSDLLRGTGDL